ncbi:MAG TPA: hypothetical protein VMW75_05910 [Thermoanaerobaculia bacterium]|nr:hypothetical protein [Thermoanaerobaculia bacterium]
MTAPIEPAAPGVSGQAQDVPATAAGETRRAPGRGPRQWLTARQLALLACLLLLGELFLFHRMAWSGLHQTAGDYVDHMLVNFICEHEYLWLVGRPDHASLWDPPVFFPARGALVYAETFLGAAPFYCPWRLLGFAPDTAYQLWMMTLPALNFAAAFLLFRRGFRFAALPALAGSFLCAFGNLLAAQVNNPQLHTIFYTYLALYFLCRLCRGGPRPWSAWGLAGAVTAQLYACFYLGWLCVFLLACAGLCMLATRELRGRLWAALRPNLAALGMAAVLAALALSPLLVRALAVVRELSWANDATTAMPQLRSWIYMGRRSLLYFWFSRSALFADMPCEPEQRLGLGLATAVCAAIGFWRRREDAWMRLLLAVTALLIVLTTQLPGGFTLWTAVRAVVPGARALRYVSRAGILLLLPAGVGLAAFVASRRRWAWTTVAVLGLCGAEQVYSEYTFSKDGARAAVAHYTAAIDPGCRSFYMAVEDDRGGRATAAWVYEVEIMMAQVASRVPAVNGGYTRFQPPGYGSLSQNVVAGPRDVERLRRDLAGWRRLHGLREEDVCWTEVARPR